MESEKRIQFNFRASSQESDVIRTNAIDAGYHNLSRYLRKCALQEHHEDEILKDISTKMSRTLGLLNQVVKRINEGKADGKSMPHVLDFAAQIFAISEEIPNRYRKSRAGESTSKRVAQKLSKQAPKKRMNPADTFLEQLNIATGTLDKIDAGTYTFTPGLWSRELVSSLNRSIISVASTSKYLRQVAPHVEDIRRVTLFALDIVEGKAATPEHKADWHDFAKDAMDLKDEIASLPPL